MIIGSHLQFSHTLAATYYFLAGERASCSEIFSGETVHVAQCDGEHVVVQYTYIACY
jgi:hypothetical protein